MLILKNLLAFFTDPQFYVPYLSALVAAALVGALFGVSTETTVRSALACVAAFVLGSAVFFVVHEAGIQKGWWV